MLMLHCTSPYVICRDRRPLLQFSPVNSLTFLYPGWWFVLDPCLTPVEWHRAPDLDKGHHVVLELQDLDQQPNPVDQYVGDYLSQIKYTVFPLLVATLYRGHPPNVPQYHCCYYNECSQISLTRGHLSNVVKVSQQKGWSGMHIREGLL